MRFLDFAFLGLSCLAMPAMAQSLQETMPAQRIDSDGVIKRVWRKVSVPGHVEAVLAAARELP